MGEPAAKRPFDLTAHAIHAVMAENGVRDVTPEPQEAVAAEIRRLL